MGISRDGSDGKIRIPIGQTASEPFFAEPFAILRMYFPASFSGTTYKFQHSEDKVSWFDSEDQTGNAITFTPTASKSRRMNDDIFPAGFLRIVSDTAEAADTDFLIRVSG